MHYLYVWAHVLISFLFAFLLCLSVGLRGLPLVFGIVVMFALLICVGTLFIWVVCRPRVFADPDNDLTLMR